MPTKPSKTTKKAEPVDSDEEPVETPDDEVEEEEDVKPAAKKVMKKGPTSDSMNPQTKTKIYRYKDIDFDRIEVSELKEAGKQQLAYINYSDPDLNMETKLLVQSGKILLNSGGIPSLSKGDDGEKGFYERDDQREFMKIPLDPKNPASCELREYLENLDAHFASNEMKTRLFGADADEYSYQSSIRAPMVKKGKSKSKETDSKYPKFDSCKMKFNMLIEGKGRKNVTKLYRMENGKRTLVHADTITEIAKEIPFLSEVKFIFYHAKVWVNNAPAQGATVILYGIGFKLIAIEYTPGKSKGVDPDTIDFISEEEDDEEASTQAKSKPIGKPAAKPMAKPTPAKGKPQKLDSDDEAAEQSGDEENDSDSGKKSPSKPNKSTPSKSTKSKDEDDADEEEEEEEEIVKPKKSGSGSKKSPAKKPVKKPAKGLESEEEEEEDEEDDEIEIKPKSSKKKPVKKPAKSAGKSR